MKKIMMTLAAAVLAISASAQVYVGGTLGLGFENRLQSETDATKNNETGMTFQIKPEIGYKLNDKMAVGAVIGFGVTNNGNEFDLNVPGYSSKGNKMEKSAISFQIEPYFRYTFLKAGMVDLFFDAGIDFEYAKLDKFNQTTFGIGVTPGLAVNLNEKFALVTKFGNGLGFKSTKPKDGDAKSEFGLGLNSLAALQFGVYYNF